MTFLGAVYFEISINLMIAFILFFYIKKVVQYSKPNYNQSNLLSLGRIFFLFACVSPIVIIFIQWAPLYEFEPQQISAEVFNGSSKTLDKLTINNLSQPLQASLYRIQSAIVENVIPYVGIPFLFSIHSYEPWIWWLLGLGGLLHALHFLNNIVKLQNLLKRGFYWKTYKNICIVLSEDINTPFATKILGKNHIVLPIWMIEKPSYMKIAIAHEGQHHRNGDTLWVIIIQVFKCLFFWNPAIYFWDSVFNTHQEFACDEALMSQKKISPYQYGRCIWAVANTASYASPRFYLTTEFGGKKLFKKTAGAQLKQRIVLLSAHKKVNLSNSKAIMVKGSAIVVLLALLGVVHLVSANSQFDIENNTPNIHFIAPTKGVVRSFFERRLHPANFQEEFHSGIDIKTQPHIPVVASASGNITTARKVGKYGLLIEIKHDNGFRTRYAHLKNINVTKGQYVKQGEVIALVGDADISTRSHLHYEIINNNGGHVNPLNYLSIADIFKDPVQFTEE